MRPILQNLLDLDFYIGVKVNPTNLAVKMLNPQNLQPLAVRMFSGFEGFWTLGFCASGF